MPPTQSKHTQAQFLHTLYTLGTRAAEAPSPAQAKQIIMQIVTMLRKLHPHHNPLDLIFVGKACAIFGFYDALLTHCTRVLKGGVERFHTPDGRGDGVRLTAGVSADDVVALYAMDAFSFTQEHGSVRGTLFRCPIADDAALTVHDDQRVYGMKWRTPSNTPHSFYGLKIDVMYPLPSFSYEHRHMAPSTAKHHGHMLNDAAVALTEEGVPTIFDGCILGAMPSGKEVCAWMIAYILADLEHNNCICYPLHNTVMAIFATSTMAPGSELTFGYGAEYWIRRAAQAEASDDSDRRTAIGVLVNDAKQSDAWTTHPRYAEAMARAHSTPPSPPIPPPPPSTSILEE